MAAIIDLPDEILLRVAVGSYKPLSLPVLPMFAPILRYQYNSPLQDCLLDKLKEVDALR